METQLGDTAPMGAHQSQLCGWWKKTHMTSVLIFARSHQRL